MLNIDIEKILAACKNAKEISGFVLISREGQLIGHFGLSDPKGVGQLATYLNSTGHQVGESLKVSPLSYCSVDFGKFRFISMSWLNLSIGIIIPASASVKIVVSLVKGVIGKYIVSKQ